MITRPEILAWLHQRSDYGAQLRSQVEDIVRQDSRLVAAWWFGSYARREPDAELLDLPPYAPTATIPGENATEPALSQLAALRRISAAMQAMEPAIVAIGAELPGALHAPIHTQIDKIEQMIRTGVTLQEINHDE